MPNQHNIAEAILARVAGHDRAAVIYGDLLELSPNHGNLWFWTAYVRTLISFTLRGPGAFLVGYVAFMVLTWLWDFCLFHETRAWWDGMLQRPAEVGYIAFQLIFLAPLATAKYGARDRLVRVAWVALLITTTIFFCMPLVPVRFEYHLQYKSLCLVVAAALLAPAQWRKPMLTLAAIITIGFLVLMNLNYLAHLYCWIYDHKPLNATSHYRYFENGYAFPLTVFWRVTRALRILNMLALYFACTRLYRSLSSEGCRFGQEEAASA